MTAKVLIFISWFCGTFPKSFVMVKIKNPLWLFLCFEGGTLWGAVLPGELTWDGRWSVSTRRLLSLALLTCSQGSEKMYVFLKAPLSLEDIHFALVSLSFAHEKIHHCVYKCQIAMQIGICVPNYPFCVFAKRMCRQILQVWVGRLLEIWLPLSQHQIRWCVLTVCLQGERPSERQPSSNVVTSVDNLHRRRLKTVESCTEWKNWESVAHELCIWEVLRISHAWSQIPECQTF